MAGLLWPACSQITGTDDTIEPESLAMLALVLAGQLQINGNFNYYNGSTSYVDTCGGFCSNGNVKVGEYIFSNAEFTQSCLNTTDCGNPIPTATPATIFEYDNTKRILYAQLSSNHPYTPSKFTFIQWMISDGVTYICPDLNDVGNQDTLAKARDFNNDGIDDYTVANDTTNINSGCAGTIFWSRLATK